MLRLISLALLLLLAACSRTDNEPGPGGVTVGEAKALDDAAAMLEERDRLEGATASGETEKK
jgi:hypothetical protein